VASSLKFRRTEPTRISRECSAGSRSAPVAPHPNTRGTLRSAPLRSHGSPTKQTVKDESWVHSRVEQRVHVVRSPSSRSIRKTRAVHRLIPDQHGPHVSPDKLAPPASNESSRSCHRPPLSTPPPPLPFADCLPHRPPTSSARPRPSNRASHGPFPTAARATGVAASEALAAAFPSRQLWFEKLRGS
jgi:hypothetical protein